MGDASFGVVASDALARESWPETVEVADLGYGALYVTLDLAERVPPLERLVLIAAVFRGREPGQLVCTRWEPAVLDDEHVQACVREAGAGIIDLDHLLVIAHRLGALPREVFCIELEPVDMSGGESLSELAAGRLPRACELARSLALEPINRLTGSARSVVPIAARLSTERA
jgi:hydrogenase maturation protease